MAADHPLRFGEALRRRHFMFEKTYRPLNHGSYGAYPTAVRDRQRELQDLTERRSDPFIRFQAPRLLLESRSAAARLLNVAVQDLVFTPNATTGINTVLRNMSFSDGDIILYFNTAYGACEKTILHVCETTVAESVRVDLVFPLEDDEIINRFKTEVFTLKQRGKRVRIAMFDTVCTFPGVRLPWEGLVRICRDHSILSLVDGAHGIGHIALEELGEVDPDFFTSNCYKWLFTPRACAILYIPSRNHHLIWTTFPTSHGFSPKTAKPAVEDDYLGDLFAWAATIDMSPYLCVPAALDFRSRICGGEVSIREYCFQLARIGGARMAEILRTEVMDNDTHTLSQCCFTMVRLPLEWAPSEPDSAADQTRPLTALRSEDGPDIVKSLMHKLMNDYDTWIPGKFYNGAAWMRISAQVYLDVEDFVWAAGVLLKLCDELRQN